MLNFGQNSQHQILTNQNQKYSYTSTQNQSQTAVQKITDYFMNKSLNEQQDLTIRKQKNMKQNYEIQANICLSNINYSNGDKQIKQTIEKIGDVFQNDFTEVILNYNAGINAFTIKKYCGQAKEEVNNQIQILQKLQNKGITLDIIDYGEENNELFIEQVAAQKDFEMIKQMMVNELLQDEQIKFINTFLQFSFFSLFRKLEKLHQEYAHGDIKPRNFVLGYDKQAYFIDFGGAVQIKDYKSYLQQYTKAYNLKSILKKKKEKNSQIFKNEDQVKFCDKIQLALSFLYLMTISEEENECYKQQEFSKLFSLLEKKVNNGMLYLIKNIINSSNIFDEKDSSEYQQTSQYFDQEEKEQTINIDIDYEILNKQLKQIEDISYFDSYLDSNEFPTKHIIIKRINQYSIDVIDYLSKLFKDITFQNEFYLSSQLNLDQYLKIRGQFKDVKNYYKNLYLGKMRKRLNQQFNYYSYEEQQESKQYFKQEVLSVNSTPQNGQTQLNIYDCSNIQKIREILKNNEKQVFIQLYTKNVQTIQEIFEFQQKIKYFKILQIIVKNDCIKLEITNDLYMDVDIVFKIEIINKLNEDVNLLLFQSQDLDKSNIKLLNMYKEILLQQQNKQANLKLKIVFLLDEQKLNSLFMKLMQYISHINHFSRLKKKKSNFKIDIYYTIRINRKYQNNSFHKMIYGNILKSHQIIKDEIDSSDESFSQQNDKLIHFLMRLLRYYLYIIKQSTNNQELFVIKIYNLSFEDMLFFTLIQQIKRPNSSLEIQFIDCKFQQDLIETLSLYFQNKQNIEMQFSKIHIYPNEQQVQVFEINYCLKQSVDIQNIDQIKLKFTFMKSFAPSQESEQFRALQQLKDQYSNSLHFNYYDILSNQQEKEDEDFPSFVKQNFTLDNLFIIKDQKVKYIQHQKYNSIKMKRLNNRDTLQKDNCQLNFKQDILNIYRQKNIENLELQSLFKIHDSKEVFLKFIEQDMTQTRIERFLQILEQSILGNRLVLNLNYENFEENIFSVRYQDKMMQINIDKIDVTETTELLNLLQNVSDIFQQNPQLQNQTTEDTFMRRIIIFVCSNVTLSDTQYLMLEFNKKQINLRDVKILFYFDKMQAIYDKNQNDQIVNFEQNNNICSVFNFDYDYDFCSFTVLFQKLLCIERIRIHTVLFFQLSIEKILKQIQSSFNLSQFSIYVHSHYDFKDKDIFERLIQNIILQQEKMDFIFVYEFKSDNYFVVQNGLILQLEHYKLKIGYFLKKVIWVDLSQNQKYTYTTTRFNDNSDFDFDSLFEQKQSNFLKQSQTSLIQEEQNVSFDQNSNLMESIINNEDFTLDQLDNSAYLTEEEFLQITQQLSKPKNQPYYLENIFRSFRFD